MTRNGNRWLRRGLLAMILSSCGVGAIAQEVALAGVLGNKALLVIDGGAPRTLGPGQRAGEVRVVSVGRDTAEVEIGSRRLSLRLGDSPVSVGATDGGMQQVSLVADSRGHFEAAGSLNGRAVRFLVDTGATAVAMGPATAQAVGIDYLRGQRSMASTANGTVPVWRVRINRVTLGGITLHDVDGLVVQAEMPHVLLGMSFLNRMDMRRDGSTMLLRQRY
ncbi:MAG: TIGR02281 family clan AA aspartic protease [Candidatus Dactylopiibacterium sp.]|nr:TIGR02281 family clan AA aspartic protease [Candidatus Dactylopiibacterium sp.]